MGTVQGPRKDIDGDEFARKFWSEQQKLANAEGVNVFVYVANAHGEPLKPTIIKMLKHAQTHPKKCPNDCVYQASIRKLKKEFGVR